jgi:Protein of unknown function (DUF3017)
MTQAPARSPLPRPRPIRRSLLARQWPLGVVLAGLVGSLAVVVVDDYRPGMLLFAGFVLLGAGLRLFLPTRRAGLLVLRSRPLDVAVMTAMGIAIAVLALLVPRIR